jgi:hypothetical protein
MPDHEHIRIVGRANRGIAYSGDGLFGQLPKVSGNDLCED